MSDTPNPAPVARQEPKPLSWVDNLLKYGSIAMMLFIMFNSSTHKRKPSTGAKAPLTSDQIMSSPNIITFEKAKLLTEEKRISSELQAQQTKEMMSKFGMTAPASPSFILPIYPTHTDEGKQLGSHRSVLKAKFILPIVNFMIFMSEHMIYDAATHIKPIWSVEDVHLSWDQNTTTSELSYNFTIPSSTYQHIHEDPLVNIYCHVLILSNSDIAKTIFPLYGVDESQAIIAIKTYPMVKHKTVKAAPKLRNLLLHDNTSSASDNVVATNDTISDGTPTMKSYWKPTLDLSFVLDIPESPRNQLPADIAKHVTLTDEGYVLPELYRNEFWITSKQLIEINSTTEALPLKITYAHISFWKWHVQNSMVDQEQQKSAMGLGGTDSETDMLREILLDTNPWLLGLTILVTLCHGLFDMLAFKNDIQFWRKKKDMRGMSVRSLMMNCFFQTVILLYLFDNDTSYMILLSSSMGLLIEYWKLSKTINIKFHWNHIIPSIQIEFQASYNDSETSTYDKEAIIHLIYVIAPAMIGYSIYSLLNQQYKSYYSWILNSMVGFIYVFGFILMTPQLYVNYRMKSVAHMPWKAMVYKSLNTFIDDLFAFIIKMPVMHRLACFRDDIIFFIYLYQRWVYRVDHTRVNEFGQEGEEEPVATIQEPAATATILDPVKDVQK